MNYNKPYKSGASRSKRNVDSAVRKAEAVKRNIISDLFDFITGRVGNNDRQLTPDEYAQAKQERDILIAELSAGLEYVNSLLDQVTNILSRLARVNGELDEIVLAYLALQHIMPTIWANNPELEELFHAEIVPAYNHILPPVDIIDQSAQALIESFADASTEFESHRDFLYEEFARYGIKKLSGPFSSDPARMHTWDDETD